MELVVVFIALAALVLGGYLVFTNRGAHRPDAGTGSTDQRRDARLGSPPMEATLENLQPGDVIVFWSGGDAIVESILDCREELLGRTTEWRWILTDTGKLLELAPAGNILFEPAQLFTQGSQTFDMLTADVGRQGLLKTFEARVRAGTLATTPVEFEHQGVSYRMKNTGTFEAAVRGKPIAVDAWRDVSPQAADNVYVGLVSSDGQRALGIWTTHIAFHTGRTLDQADIKGIYRR